MVTYERALDILLACAIGSVLVLGVFKINANFADDIRKAMILVSSGEQNILTPQETPSNKPLMFGSPHMSISVATAPCLTPQQPKPGSSPLMASPASVMQVRIMDDSSIIRPKNDSFVHYIQLDDQENFMDTQYLKNLKT